MRALVALLGYFFLLLPRPGYAESADGSGLKTSLAVDIVGQGGFKKNSGATDRLDVREAEAVFYAPIDHLFDGNLSFAAHAEGGVPQVELHEAYIGSTKLIPRSRFRVGQFFLGIGRLNQIHRHDWPFTLSPKVNSAFFDNRSSFHSEAAMDTGAEFATLLPLPFYLEVLVGVTNGWVFGHSHTDGETPYVPTHYARTTTYFDLPWDGGTQIGLNYLGRKDAHNANTTLLGVDLTAKWREAQVIQFLFQSEFWYRILSRSSGGTANALGFYLYPQYYLGSGLFAGIRVDYFSDRGLTNAIGEAIPNGDWDFSPSVTYRPSEFTTLRMSYHHNSHGENGNTVRTGQFLEAQAVFILGAHPAHDF